jgi:DNA double-strand break repair helicase HerA and related ATPase
MATADGILIGKSEGPVVLDPRYANRHGLVAGATGTGKTVTLQRFAEGFSALGVPVFLCDVKGDLSGLCAAGATDGPFAERARQLGISRAPHACPVLFWDVFGEQGHPVRATVSEMGPLLLSRLLELNDTQDGVLNAAFAVADDRGLLLLDLKDLRAILQFIADNAKELQSTYGNVAPTTVGAIQRKLLVIEREGGEAFFGEPSLDLKDLMRVDANGQGMVSVLAANKLINKPRLYATFLLWLLSELFEELPEVGDHDRPKLVLFFDEAHLLFDDAPKTLIDKVEQVVRLIRSKGVGVYFVTQNPTDVPEDVLAQLGNRVQHALRAFTAKDQKAVKAAASTFRANPSFSAEQAITELGVGEALVSTLEDKGTPGVVQRTLIAPPASRVGPADLAQRQAVTRGSPIVGRYDLAIDRDSAYEQLRARAEIASRQAEAASPAQRAPTGRSSRARRAPESVAEAFAKSAARAVGSRLGREIIRGVLGSLFRGR